jgi:hypothetical protein
MSTPPLSSSSSSNSSPSPSVRDSDEMTNLGDNVRFDDPETLELLLQTLNQHGDQSASANSTEDWSGMSSWIASDGKSTDLGTDFNFAFPMDLDIDPLGMSVDPNSLHFNTSIFSQSALSENPYFVGSLPQGQDQSAFPFDSSSWPTGAHLEPGTRRRLSVTSSSSSSGASFSPILEPQPTSGNSPSSDGALSDSDLAFELAQRVRQAAGVTLAVPVSPQVRQLAAASIEDRAAFSHASRAQAAAVPAVKRIEVASQLPEATSRASPPAPTLSEAGSPSSSSFSAAHSPSPEAPAHAPSTRPKTSHTTIERRYRTNLNARITGLRQSVPALRVLELKDGVPSPYGDVVDVRGFVDGVKVARKMSKANILGKATEYIRSVFTPLAIIILLTPQ